MNKFISALFITLIMSLPAMAIEPPEGAKIPYQGTNRAYTGMQFNEVLEAYGLELSVEAAKSLPPCFARVLGDIIDFRFGESMVCSPSQYHSILAAYGLELTPENVGSKLAKMDIYATVQDGEVIFGDERLFMWSSDWTTILGAYSKAQ